MREPPIFVNQSYNLIFIFDIVQEAVHGHLSHSLSKARYVGCLTVSVLFRTIHAASTFPEASILAVDLAEIPRSAPSRISDPSRMVGALTSLGT